MVNTAVVSGLDFGDPEVPVEFKGDGGVNGTWIDLYAWGAMVAGSKGWAIEADGRVLADKVDDNDAGELRESFVGFVMYGLLFYLGVNAVAQLLRYAILHSF